jgi:hypothetical protein
MKRDEVIFKALGLLKEARLALEMWKDVAPAVSLCADIDKVLAKLAALAPETNQPVGTGYYDLTIRVGVYRDSRGYETVHYHNNGSNYLGAETKDITGHWQPITPEK